MIVSTLNQLIEKNYPYFRDLFVALYLTYFTYSENAKHKILLANETKMLRIHSSLRVFGRLLLVYAVLVSCQIPTKLLDSEREDLPILAKTTYNGQQVQISPLVEGEINLYYRMIPISQANLYTPFFPDNDPAEVAEYYIGETEVRRIDNWNYEYVLKEVFVEAPYLLKKLGHQGFRFENLSQMVNYYNENFATKWQEK